MSLLSRHGALPALVFSCLLCSPARADLDFTIEGRPYRLVTNERTFAAAEADAISKGGHLVHIDSQAENDAIFAAISAAVPTNSTASDGGGAVYVWIGGTETSEGNYAWVDSTTIPFWTGGKTGSAPAGQYANWGRGTVSSSGPEPDNFNSTQNRAAMAITAWPSSGATKIGQPGQWNDIRDNNTLVYVIEFDGMWANFRMSHGGTPKGTFTAKLFYDKAPLTVGNFVNLAEGRQTFVDERNGTVVTRPYYNGLKCHRIIAGFMIQGGCPRGNGTSGPGYKFPDEFDSTLRHTVAGMLSMANSGVDTNGSQFFVTVAPTTHLDDKHSVFGQVVDGYNTVVQPLSTVPTVNPAAQDDRPVQDVIIEEVKIHRAGTAARALNPPLPTLELVPLTASAGAGGACLLDFPRSPFTGYDLFNSTNLSVWEVDELGSYGATTDSSPINGKLVAPVGASKCFFRMARLNFQPLPSLVGKRVVVESASLRVTYNLTTATTGTFNLFQTSGTNISGDITSWSFTRTSLWDGNLSATIPAGQVPIGNSEIRFLDASIRPAVRTAVGVMYLPDHSTYYNLPGVSRLTITNLP